MRKGWVFGDMRFWGLQIWNPRDWRYFRYHMHPDYRDKNGGGRDGKWVVRLIGIIGKNFFFLHDVILAFNSLLPITADS